MILRRLALRDFGRFANYETTFAPGLNVIFGDNEEGKTTLREAIGWVLFEDPKGTSKSIAERTRWGASGKFAIGLEFEEDGKVYNLFKDCQARKALLKENGDGQLWQDSKVIGTRITELLGLPSQDVFNSTVRIAQPEITEIKKGNELADRLQALITGGGQDTQASKVLKEISETLAALKRTSKNGSGPLAALPTQIADGEAELEKKRGALSGADQAKKKKAASEDTVATLEKELAEKEAIERNCRARFDLLAELNKARKTEEDLEGKTLRAQELREGIDQAERALADFAPMLALSQEQLAEVGTLEVQAAAAEPPASPAVQQKPSDGARTVWLLAGGALAVIGLIGGLIFQPALLLLVLLGLGMAVFEAWRARQQSADPQALALELRLQEQQQERVRAANRLKEILDGLACASVTELRRKRKEAGTLQHKLEVDRAILETLLNGGSEESIETERRAVSKKLRDIGEQLDEPAMRLAEMDQLSYQRLLTEMQALRERISGLRSELTDLEVTVRAAQVSVEDVNTLEETLQELRERLDAAREKEQILTLTREVLQEARTATMIAAKDILKQEVDGLVGEITRGRYSQVEVDPANLEIRLYSPEKGELIPVAFGEGLSTGTIEQVYLAARLAMARLLAQGRRPPLIFDDPFITFDAPRTAAVIGLCKRLALENQILLFTCHQGYDAVADKVIRLPALG